MKHHRLSIFPVCFSLIPSPMQFLPYMYTLCTKITTSVSKHSAFEELKLCYCSFILSAYFVIVLVPYTSLICISHNLTLLLCILIPTHNNFSLNKNILHIYWCEIKWTFVQQSHVMFTVSWKFNSFLDMISIVHCMCLHFYVYINVLRYFLVNVYILYLIFF